MTADDIIAIARSAIGTPFVHQGRVAGKGLDCVGLPMYVADRLGVEYVDVIGYPRRPEGGKLEATFDAHVESGVLVRVKISEMQAGDFLMLRFGGQPQHLAIFTGENIIHSYQQVGKVCEHRLDDVWRRRIVRVYRMAGVEA